MISTVVKELPKEEKYRLVDQMIRALISVTANIAEGHGCFHYQENIQYCRQARGGLVELYDRLTVALDEEYIDQDKFDKYVMKYEEATKMLNGYIAYMQKRKSDG